MADDQQVVSVLATKDVDSAEFVKSMLQQDKLNDNLGRQGLPKGNIVSITLQQVNLLCFRTAQV